MKIFSFEEAYNASLLYFNGDSLAAKVFVDKYALRDNLDNLLEDTPEMMHRRLAREFARIESLKFKKPLTEDEIFSYFDHFRYIVCQGSPMFGIGNNYQIQSLGNCFTLGEHPLDSYGGILYADQMLVQLAKRRCGTGLNLDNIRPKGLPTQNAAKTTDGISVFVERFSNTIREVAQCIAKGQLVLSRRGLKPIEEIVIGDEVWTQKGWIQVINVFRNGRKPLVELQTKRGFKIKTTREHIFVDEWLREKALKNFQIGDNICLFPGTLTHCSLLSLTIPNVENINGQLNEDVVLPTVLSLDLAYLLGYSYGDGYVQYNKDNEPISLTLACSHDYPEIEQKLINIIDKQFQYRASVCKGTGRVNKVGIYSKKICKFLQINQCLKTKAIELIFPNIISNSNSEIQLAFIAGLIDSDGCCSQNKKGGIRIDSINEIFLRECHKILMSNGILARFFNNTTKSRKTHWSPIFRLSINGKGMQTLSKRLITHSLKLQYCESFSYKDYLLTPYQCSLLHIRRINNSYNCNQDLSYGTILRLQDCGVVSKDFRPLILDTIVAIQESEEDETYDLQLEQEHFFYCNGFYVHNSGRRGALLQGLSVHHPEIETFINLKRDLTKATGANLSVIITDEFMQALEKDEMYELRWPVESSTPRIKYQIKASKIWEQIIDSAWTSAEPGLLFRDTARKWGLSHQYGVKDKRFLDIITNPCGEIWMGADSCRLMLLNLYSYVRFPFTEKAFFDYELFGQHVQLAQRLSDNLVDLEVEKIDRILAKIASDPEPDYVKKIENDMWQSFREVALLGRRTGLGTTGLGDTLAALGLRYGSEESFQRIEQIYFCFAKFSLLSSCLLAKELGAFSLYDAELERDHPWLKMIFEKDEELKLLHSKYGRRNVSLTTCSPAGSVSILTQTTSGIEPVFLLEYVRRRKILRDSKKFDFIDASGDKWENFIVYHHHFQTWKQVSGKTNIKDSPYFRSTSSDIDWQCSVRLQAIIQKYISHSISKTCNIPEHASRSLVDSIYREAYKSGCKGFTIYREGSRSGVLLNNESKYKKLIKTEAPKRPKELRGEIFDINYKKDKLYVAVGFYEGDVYEVFTGINFRNQIEKAKGKIVKLSRGKYVFVTDLNKEYHLTNGHTDENADSLTRVLSAGLRHGCSLEFLVHQLEKSHGDLQSFSKVIARVLKKLIKDGTKVSGELCPQCKGSNLIRNNGCKTCIICGWSACD